MSDFRDYNINIHDKPVDSPIDIKLIDEDNHDSIMTTHDTPRKFCRLLQNSLLHAGFDWKEIDGKCRLTSVFGDSMVTFKPEDAACISLTLIPEDKTFRLPSAYSKYFNSNGMYRHVPYLLIANDDTLTVGTYQVTILVGGTQTSSAQAEAKAAELFNLSGNTDESEDSPYEPWYIRLWNAFRSWVWPDIDDCYDADYDIVEPEPSNIIPIQPYLRRK